MVCRENETREYGGAASTAVNPPTQAVMPQTRSSVGSAGTGEASTFWRASTVAGWSSQGLSSHRFPNQCSCSKRSGCLLIAARTRLASADGPETGLLILIVPFLGFVVVNAAIHFTRN